MFLYQYNSSNLKRQLPAGFINETSGRSPKYQSQTFTKRYRFGFNTQEQDDEVAGDGNINTAEYWEYDTRLARRWNRDPVVIYSESPYIVLKNCPLVFLDPLGDEIDPATKETGDKYRQSLDNNLKNVKDAIAYKQDQRDKLSALSKTKKDRKEVAKLDEQLKTLRFAENKLNEAIKQYDDMAADPNQVYSFKQWNQSRGTTRYENGMVVMYFTDFANLSHEITHGYEYYSGSSAFQNGDFTLTHDINDEVAGYQMGYAYTVGSAMGNNGYMGWDPIYNRFSFYGDHDMSDKINAKWVVKNYPALYANTPKTAMNITLKTTVATAHGALRKGGHQGFSSDVLREYGNLTIREYYNKINSFKKSEDPSRIMMHK